MKVDIYNELVLQYDIHFNGITIYQYTIDEIFQYGVEKYNTLLIPYSLTLDAFQIPFEEQDNYNVYDLILLSEDLFLLLIHSIRHFCKTDNIKMLEDGIHVDEGVINKNNFEEFSDIILKIHSRERAKQDKLPENPKQRELELKLRALRAKHKSPKSEFQLCDIINNVKYGGKYYITTEEIKKMTLWELNNAFQSKLGVSNYENNFSIALTCGDKENSLQNNHWTKLLKVDK